MLFGIDQVCLRRERECDARFSSVFGVSPFTQSGKPSSSSKSRSRTFHDGHARGDLERVFKFAAAALFAGHEAERFQQAA